VATSGMQFDGASATHRHFLALCLSVLSVDARIHRQHASKTSMEFVNEGDMEELF